MKDKNKPLQTYLEIPTLQYLQSPKHQLHSYLLCISPVAAYNMHESNAGAPRFVSDVTLLSCRLHLVEG